jgi:2-dehydro-3-deoxygluconokinase
MIENLQARLWRKRSILGVGEVMLEFASTGGDSYRRGYAGDSFNTCWHAARLLGPHGRAAYCTRVGTDEFSDQLVAFMASGGIDTEWVSRDPERQLGLYVIKLFGAERHFSFWREHSAARRLADLPGALREAFRDQGLIHFSGITLAVVGATGRRHLLEALHEARQGGTVVSFDPNLRRSLWPDLAELRRATHEALEVVDIALPSFDDEAQTWDDAHPAATLERFERAGVGEIVVKNGAADVVFGCGNFRGSMATPAVAKVIDTTGAGDAFNAGYLAARLLGLPQAPACEVGQGVAGEVIGHHGALVPAEALAACAAGLRAQAGAA